MQGRPTDHRNTDLWQLELDIIHGKANNKVLWQPRILCWVADKEFLKEPLPFEGGFEGYDEAEMYNRLGCSNRVYDYNGCFQSKGDPRVTSERIQHSPMEVEYITHTPVGDVNTIYQRNTSNPGSYTVKWPVVTEEDMKVYMWMAERTTWSYNAEVYERVAKHWGRRAAPSAFLPRIPIQSLLVDTMGVEGTIYALQDYPDTVHKYFQVLEESQQSLLNAVNESPIEVINYGDNVHCAILPPDLFEK